MLVQLFRSNRPAILLALLALIPALFWPHFRASWPQGNVMPAYALLLYLTDNAPMLRGILLLLAIFGSSVQLTSLVNNSDLVDRRNHVPALLFPLLVAVFAPSGALGPALFGTPFVVWALQRCWSITSGGSAMGAVFDAGFLVGVAALFFLPYAFLLVVVWASISMIRPFHWREYVVPMLGAGIVFYMTWAVMHLADAGSWLPLRTIIQGRPDPANNPMTYTVLFYLLLAGFLVFSFAGFANQYSRGVVREQNLRSAFLAFVLTMGVIMGILALINGWFPPVLVATPLAVLFTFALLGKKRPLLAELGVLFLLLLGFWRQYGI